MKITEISFITLLSFGFFVSCVQNAPKSNNGFLDSQKVDSHIEFYITENYPEIINKRIKKAINENFSDSLRNRKVVYVQKRYNYFPNSKKVKFIDTAGYFISINNHEMKLIWEFDFNNKLKIIRQEEISYEKKRLLIDEGKKIMN